MTIGNKKKLHNEAAKCIKSIIYSEKEFVQKIKYHFNIVITKKKIKNYKFDKSMFIHPFTIVHDTYNNISLNHFSLGQRIFKLI